MRSIKMMLGTLVALSGFLFMACAVSTEEIVEYSMAFWEMVRLDEPFRFEGHTVVIGASIGISLAPRDGDSGEELLKLSDVALYRAKEESRGSFRFFEPGMVSVTKWRPETDVHEIDQYGAVGRKP